MTVILRNKSTGREIKKNFVTDIEQTEDRIQISFDTRIGVVTGCSVMKSEYEIAKVVK